jgi:hypothetical protein
MVLKSDDLKFFHGLSAGLKADSEAVGRDMGRSLQHHIGDDTKALFVPTGKDESLEVNETYCPDYRI